jgi:hypothetical protein
MYSLCTRQVEGFGVCWKVLLVVVQKGSASKVELAAANWKVEDAALGSTCLRCVAGMLLVQVWQLSHGLQSTGLWPWWAGPCSCANAACRGTCCMFVTLNCQHMHGWMKWPFTPA